MLKPLQERQAFAGYSDKEMPLGSYALLVGLYGAGLAGFLAWMRGSGRKLPARLEPGDVVTFGLATHKLTRIIARDWVTSPLRAPLVRYQGPRPGGEVEESIRVQRGFRRAVADLLTCTYCLGPWVAGSLICARAVAPRGTRLVASIFALTTVSDFLHRSYGWMEEGVKRTRARTLVVEESEGPLEARH
jgi:hypothetical protein